MKKTIGIPGWSLEKGFGVSENHIEYISKFGNPVILMPWEEFHEGLDLLYLPGGLDINPVSYGQTPGYKTTDTDVFKQFFFDCRLANYINNNVPTFGVCLGAQQLNVFFGGHLIQNLQWHPKSPSRGSEGHKVKDLTVKSFKKKEDIEFGVNSHHHQGILTSTLGQGLEATCVAIPAEKVVEAFRHETLPIVGIQWHPEEWYDAFSTSEMRRLLKLDKTEE